MQRYRVRALPAAGALLKPEDKGEKQMALFDVCDDFSNTP
jgi:hypothetical protein